MIFMLLAGTVIFGAGCNSGGGIGGNSPKAVLEKFLSAIGKKDMDEAKKYVTKDSEAFVNMIKMGISMAGDTENEIYKEEDIIIGDAIIDGDKATIPVTNKNNEDKSNFILKKENGKWKVAFNKESMMEMSGQKLEDTDLKDLQEEFSTEDMKAATEALKNMSKEDIEKANKVLDSMKTMYEELNKDGKMDEAMKEATKMLEQMQKTSQ